MAVKSIMGGAFSFLLFGFTQVVIDLESAYWLVQNEWPVHRTLHTYLGATFVLVFALLIGKPVCEALLRALQASGIVKGVEPKISFAAALSGSAIGVYSHVFLDSIMHSDMRPFAPFAEGNNMLQAITIRELHLFCVYSGVLGLAVMIVVKKIRDRDKP